MNRFKMGFLSSALATFIAGSMLLMNNALHSFPEVHVARSLAAMLGAPDHVMVGVVAILVVGILGCGALFVTLAPRLPMKSYLAKSLAFGAASWLLMMVVFMPLVGAGFFGLARGADVPIAMLVLHFVFWLVLGISYRWLVAPIGQSNTGQDSTMSLESNEGR